MNKTPLSPLHFYSLLALLWGGIIIIYGQSLRWGNLLYDDPANLQDHALTIFSPFSIEYWKYLFTHSTLNLWHPLTDLSHQCILRTSSPEQNLHRLTNVLLHGGACSLWIVFFKRSCFPSITAYLVIVLLAWHPLCVEPVCWISGRKDVLCHFFIALTAVLHLYKSRHLILKVIYYLSVTLCVMSKPIAVMLPLFLIILEYTAAGRDAQFLQVVKKNLVLFIWSVFLISITLYFQSIGTQAVVDERGILPRLAGGLWTIMESVKASVIPLNLHLARRSPTELHFFPLLLQVFLITGGSVVCYLLRRKMPALLMGWIWVIVALLPTCGIIRAGNHLYADRYVYLALLGIIIMLTTVVKKRIVVFPVAVIFLILSHKQVQVWENDETVFLHCLNLDPLNDEAHSHLAGYYHSLAKVEQRDIHLEKALQIAPHNISAHLLQGELNYEAGNFKNAYENYMVASLMRKTSWVYERLSALCLKLNKREEAYQHLESAMRYAKNQEELQYLLEAKEMLFPDSQ